MLIAIDPGASGVTLRNEHVASQFRGILAAFSSQGRAYEAAEERREWAREDEARQQAEVAEAQLVEPTTNAKEQAIALDEYITRIGAAESKAEVDELIKQSREQHFDPEATGLIAKAITAKLATFKAAKQP